MGSAEAMVLAKTLSSAVVGLDSEPPEASACIRGRVQTARNRQIARFKESNKRSNAEMGPRDVREFCKVESDAQTLLRTGMTQLHLSARAFHRTLKLARTIAEPCGCRDDRVHSRSGGDTISPAARILTLVSGQA